MISIKIWFLSYPYMERKKEVTVENAQNLKKIHSELKSYPGNKVLIITFVKKFSTSDTTNQGINIGKYTLINI